MLHWRNVWFSIGNTTILGGRNCDSSTFQHNSTKSSLFRSFDKKIRAPGRSYVDVDAGVVFYMISGHFWRKSALLGHLGPPGAPRPAPRASAAERPRGASQRPRGASRPAPGASESSRRVLRELRRSALRAL